jgi:predicted nucleic acid-binding protein
VTAVLVDTSVWRHFFAGTIARLEAEELSELLDEDDRVVCHPAVVGELVLGGLSKRDEALMARLPRVAELTSNEVLALIRAHKLTRKGVGWVDCQLLGSALLESCSLWSLDRALASAAAALRVGHARAKL